MTVLAIDSATDILSVALGSGERWSETSIDMGLKHAERVMGLVDSCLSQAGIRREELELVACAKGPGSFTGLRIGMSSTKGIAAGLGIPWIAVPTLDALAWGYDFFDGAVAPIIDGRKGRFYSAVYERGSRVSEWLDLPLAELAGLLDTYPVALVTGPDAEQFRSYASERPGFRVDERGRRPVARALAVLALERLGREGPGSPDEGPLYLRPSEAEESALRREGLPRLGLGGA